MGNDDVLLFSGDFKYIYICLMPCCILMGIVFKDVFRTSHTHKGRKHGKNMISTKLRMQWKMLERTSNAAVETPPYPPLMIDHVPIKTQYNFH